MASAAWQRCASAAGTPWRSRWSGERVATAIPPEAASLRPGLDQELADRFAGKCYTAGVKNMPWFLLASSLIFAATPVNDPYSSLSRAERELLKPQVERWVKDQIKHNWSDLWEIQDQTPELKNELLLGDRDHPDLSRIEYVQAMQETMGVGYPEIKAFTLSEIQREN